MTIAIFYNLPFGGAKRVVMEHVKGLKKLGHKVDVFTVSHNKDIFEPGNYSDNEYRYEFLQTRSTFPVLSRLKKDYEVFYKLKKIHKQIAEDIDKKNYDIVLVHTDAYTQSPFILRFLKTKKVYFCLEPLRIVYEESLGVSKNIFFPNRLYELSTRAIRKKIDKENAQSSDNILAMSYFAREYIIQAYNLYPKIAYLGVDELLFKQLNLKKKNQVLFVAEKEYIYGYDLAEAALSLIPKQDRPELKIIFGTKKSQRISDKELVKLYNESLLTLSLSRFDTFGLTPLESAACGTPVIATNVAAYKETILDGKTGFLVEFDPVEIAKKIIFIKKNHTTSLKMGKAGREWIKNKWTWDRQIKNLEKLLLEYISIP